MTDFRGVKLFMLDVATFLRVRLVNMIIELSIGTCIQQSEQKERKKLPM